MTVEPAPVRPRSHIPRHGAAWIAAVAMATAFVFAGCTNAPERPGAPLERDGSTPVITDPGGVANELDDLVDDGPDVVTD